MALTGVQPQQSTYMPPAPPAQAPPKSAPPAPKVQAPEPSQFTSQNKDGVGQALDMQG